MSPSLSLPEFFVDRSLGKRVLPEALRAAGWTLRTHAEVYGKRDEVVPDAEWLELCGQEELVVLTKDRHIRYRRAEIAAIRRHRVMAFALGGAQLTALEQVARLLANAERIEEACATSGPFIYAVHAKRILRVFPQ